MAGPAQQVVQQFADVRLAHRTREFRHPHHLAVVYAGALARSMRDGEVPVPALAPNEIQAVPQPQ